jgi:hypothetical protein
MRGEGRAVVNEEEEEEGEEDKKDGELKRISVLLENSEAKVRTGSG